MKNKKIPLSILLLLIIASIALTGCNQEEILSCESLTANECLEHQDRCQIWTETITSSFAGCHSIEFCQEHEKNIKPSQSIVILEDKNEKAITIGKKYILDMKEYQENNGRDLKLLDTKVARCPGCYNLKFEFALDSMKQHGLQDIAIVTIQLNNWGVVDVVTGFGVDPNSIPEEITDFTVIETLEQDGIKDTDCETPMRYLALSHCPHTSKCIKGKCAVVGPTPVEEVKLENFEPVMNPNINTSVEQYDNRDQVISEYLLTPKEFAWKTEAESQNGCVFENLDNEDDLFPLSFFQIDKFSHKIPRDGSLYTEDIKKIFPKNMQDEIFNFEKSNNLDENFRKKIL